MAAAPTALHLIALVAAARGLFLSGEKKQHDDDRTKESIEYSSNKKNAESSSELLISVEL
jgi:hypothetical protein